MSFSKEYVYLLHNPTQSYIKLRIEEYHFINRPIHEIVADLRTTGSPTLVTLGSRGTVHINEVTHKTDRYLIKLGILKECRRLDGENIELLYPEYDDGEDGYL